MCSARLRALFEAGACLFPPLLFRNNHDDDDAARLSSPDSEVPFELSSPRGVLYVICSLRLRFFIKPITGMFIEPLSTARREQRHAPCSSAAEMILMTTTLVADGSTTTVVTYAAVCLLPTR